MSSGPDRPGTAAHTALSYQPVPELTTVACEEAVVHDGPAVRRHGGLAPDTEHERDGFHFRTLPAPGERLATVATVNDVHFGELECGVVSGTDVGPTFRSAPGEPPYPTMMNEAAVAEISSIAPDAVLVKGDLTADGTEAQYQAFLDVYATAFGDRLRHVRGNHESYNHAPFGAIPVQEVVLDGARLAMLDTSLDGAPSGAVTADQLDWLDALAADSDRPVLVFGHHHPWNPASNERPDGYFGIRPDDSEALAAVVARRTAIVGYFAGHTHRNRVRHFPGTGRVPWAEVACVKDYPGGWAEYRIHEGGILQVFHRISTPAALSWTERTRHMYEGTYAAYAFGRLSDRCFVLPVPEARG